MPLVATGGAVDMVLDFELRIAEFKWGIEEWAAETSKGAVVLVALNITADDVNRRLRSMNE